MTVSDYSSTFSCEKSPVKASKHNWTRSSRNIIHNFGKMNNFCNWDYMFLWHYQVATCSSVCIINTCSVVPKADDHKEMYHELMSPCHKSRKKTLEKASEAWGFCSQGLFLHLFTSLFKTMNIWHLILVYIYFILYSFKKQCCTYFILSL